MPEPTSSESPSLESDRRWWLIALVVAIPIVVLIVALSQRHWYPTGDQAQAELRMRSLPSHPPLVGAAGRIEDAQHRQGNHPGPLMFWATWPLYLILGRSAWAFEAATALVNVAWLTLSVWLVKRRAGLGATAWYGFVALVLIGGFGLDALSQPWNPWVALLPFAVLLLATWSAIEGDRWAPVIAVAAASYALQGHVGYLPLAIPLCGVALVAPLWRWFGTKEAADGDIAGETEAGETEAGEEAEAPAGRRAPISTWALPLGVAVGVALIAWSGPFWDVLTNHPSNVSKLIANFSSPSEAPIGLKNGIEAVLKSSAPLGSWVWGGSAVTGSAWPGKIFLLVWAVVAAIVMLRGERPALSRFNALLTAVLLTGMFAVSRIFGSLYLYTFRWIVVVVAMQVFTLGWGLATLLPRPSPVAQRRLAGLAVVGLVLLSAVTAVRISRQDIPYDQSSRTERALAPAVAAKLDKDQRYLVRWDDPAYLGGIGFGLILDLERRGFHVGSDPRTEAAVEPHRVMCPGDYDAVLTVVTGIRNIEAYQSKDGYTEVASTDPRLDPAAWDRSFQQLLDVLKRQGTPKTPDELEHQLNGFLLNTGQTQQVHDLAADLVLGGVPSAVFVQDPAPDPGPVPHDPLTEPCWK